MTDSLKKRLMSADEAVRLIPDGATVQITGVALVCSSAMILKNIGGSFLATGHPRELCVVSEGSPSSNMPGYDYFQHLTHKGLLRRVIGGHMGYHHALFPLIRSNQIEGYNISQGVQSIMTSEYVAGKDGYLTKVGLRTQQDPRFGGCKLNEGMATEDLVELRVVNGEEYLWYKAIRRDVAVLKASYADLSGNISYEAEPANMDALASAMAAKNGGGKVIVYVKALREERFNPRSVQIPFFLVDAIIVDPDLIQAAPHLSYNPCFSNEARCGEGEMQSILGSETKNGAHKREIAQKVIARRAAMELRPDAVVNIGIGIPQMISGEAISLGIDMSSVIMTTETGIIGGVQLPSVFGVSMNADSVYDQASQFRFYEGGGLDIGFLGALEIDAEGNVNVCKKGSYLAGVGGFDFIVYSAKKLVFCFPFMRGSGYKSEAGKLIAFDGADGKIVKKVECITMNAGVELKNRKTVLYITERCVFRLADTGLELVEIGMSVKRGEIHAIVGENGAGKSMGIGVIYQEFTLAPALSVAENIFLGAYPGNGWTVDFKDMNKKAVEAMKRIGVKIPPQQPVFELAVGLQQIVEITRSLVKDIKPLIMDEPTAPLTTKEVEQLVKIIRSLKEQGITVIYISHRLEEVFRLADRVSVLRDGQFLATLNVAETSMKELIRLMVGRELKGKYPERERPIGEEVLRVEGLTGNGVRDISFTLHKGEILGFAGLLGCGRTETMQLLYGAARKNAGKLFINGKESEIKNTKDALRKGIGMIPEDRKRHGIFLWMTIKWNTGIGCVSNKLRKYVILVDRKKEKKLALEYMAKLRTKAPSVEQLVANLSGGNQQKVVVSKVLATDAAIMIFDEPTRGIDVGAKQEMYGLIRELANEGKSVILVSSEMGEVIGLSDRIVVLCEGRQMGVLERGEFDQERLLTLASGLATYGKGDLTHE